MTEPATHRDRPHRRPGRPRAAPGHRRDDGGGRPLRRRHRAGDRADAGPGRRAETGLDDFGADGFLEPLTVLLESLRTEAPAQLVRAHHGLRADQPAAQEPAADPAGPDRAPRDPRPGDRPADHHRRAAPHRHHPPPEPHLRRSGAALAALLGEHRAGPRARRRDGPDGVDPRITRCDANLAVLTQALPYFPRMYDIGTHNAHEEINLLAIDFSTMYFDTLAPMPTWRGALPGPRPDPALRVPEDRAEGAPVPAGRRPLDPQVAPAPRAVRAAHPARSPTPPCWSPIAIRCR